MHPASCLVRHTQYMAAMAYKEPSFRDRAALSSDAKKKALEKLRNKPPVDPEIVAQRQAAAIRREEKEAERRAAREAAAEQARLDKIAAEKAAKRAAEEAVRRAEEAEVERKAARDARYAARKARKR